MNGEINWIYFDRLASHYGAAISHVERLESLGVELSEVCKNLEHRPPTMTDFSLFFSSRTEQHTEVARAAAWISQHVFSARAWCVGQKIVETPHRKPPHSPLVKQLEELGLQSVPVPLKALQQQWAGFRMQSKLDCLLFDSTQDVIFLVKGQTFVRGNRGRSKLAKVHPQDRATLFGAEKACFKGLFAPAEGIAALCFAQAVIKASFPSMKVRAFFATLEEPGGMGRFQFHEASEATTSRGFGQQSIALDDLPVVHTHEDFKDKLESDGDSLLALPNWPETNYLKKAPVDLPIRAMMILKALAAEQQAVSKRLYLRSAAEISSAVAKEYCLHYPKNMSRHDLDRLQRIGLIQWAPDGSARLGLTSAGVYRSSVLEHRFNPMLPRSPAIMLNLIKVQEDHWLQAAKV